MNQTHNAQVFIDFLARYPREAVSKIWVIWMLETIRDANAIGRRINPLWVEASLLLPDDPMPDIIPTRDDPH